jgi:hypothetical protein
MRIVEKNGKSKVVMAGAVDWLTLNPGSVGVEKNRVTVEPCLLQPPCTHPHLRVNTRLQHHNNNTILLMQMTSRPSSGHPNHPQAQAQQRHKVQFKFNIKRNLKVKFLLKTKMPAFKRGLSPFTLRLLNTLYLAMQLVLLAMI